MAAARYLRGIEDHLAGWLSPHRRRRSLALLLVAACGLAMLSPVVSAAAAAAPRSPSITFYFGLKRPEARADAAFYAVENPASRSYRRFLPLSQISRRYGASPATRTAFAAQIRKLGLSSRVDPSGVFARVTGTVAQFDKAFHVDIKRTFTNFPNVFTYLLPAHQRLRLPAALRPLVTVVDAFYAHTAPASGKAAAGPRGQQATVQAAASGPKNKGTWKRGCRAAKATGAYSYAQVRHAYGLQSLGSGARASVAILNAGEDAPASDIAANARCFHYPKAKISVLRTDGQTAPFGRGTFEPQEDLALVRGMAPGMRTLTFTKAWADPALLFLGASQVLAERDRPDVLSISYGWCDRDVEGKGAPSSSQAGASLMDAILVRLGLTGVATFASAGDSGSSCNGDKFAGVAWPAASPFLTAVGGTRLVLNKPNRRVREVVWNDLRWLPAEQGGGAGGGGFATIAKRPPYQRALSLPGDLRAAPDVAAAASSFPGYPVVLSNHWVADAGTSAAAPLVAAGFAVIDARARALGKPLLGPVNGLLYYLYAHDRRALYDVVSGTNKYYPSVRGWRARRGYDLASGLGVPQFAVIAKMFPRLAPGRIPRASRAHG
jgi:subtilase family serine protease